jgi:hypothetical protein
MNSGPHPAREEYVLDGVGSAHHYVGFADRVFRLTDRIDMMPRIELIPWQTQCGGRD